MTKFNSWRAKKYSRRLTLDMVTGIPETTTYTGNMRDEYNAYIHSDFWKNKRAERIALDGGKCADCGSTEKLQVHHLTYVRFRHELMDDLLTLCKKCHRDRHVLSVYEKFLRGIR